MRNTTYLIYLSIILVSLLLTACAPRHIIVTDESAEEVIKELEGEKEEEIQKAVSAAETPEPKQETTETIETVEEQGPEPEVEEVEKIQTEIKQSEIKEKPKETDTGDHIIHITSDKRLDPNYLEIKAQESVVFVNDDSDPHMIRIYKGVKESFKSEIHVTEKLESGESEAFTFFQKDTYLVKDVFSGTARGFVTVQ